jgi:hypothetical protein
MGPRYVLAAGSLALLLMAGPAAAGFFTSYNFESAWSGDYAPGWENTAYRHGPAPVGQMMQYTSGGHNSSGAMKLIAASTPESWMWWAAVNPQNLPSWALQKSGNPWVSAWYYDQGWESGAYHSAGQLFSVPSWVNPYIDPGEDWTDIQFGARMNQATPNDNYYFVAAGENSPGWQDTGVDRFRDGWVQLKMQLSSADGRVHFFVNGTEVGASYRNDYVDLGEASGLYTMFTSPLSDWGSDMPYTIWDDFEVGSDAVPEPCSLVLLAAGAAGLFVRRRRQGSPD